MLQGNVKVEDTEAAMTMEGTTALYNLDDESIEIWGDPITIRDVDGNGAAGVRALLYDFQSESLEMRSAANAPPPTAGSDT